MRILYITNHLNIGGVTSYVLTLAAGLKKRGHSIYIASSGGALLPELSEKGIIYVPIPIKTKKEVGPKILASLLKLNKFLRHEDIDLVHTHSRTTQVLGSLLNKKKGIRHISTCHGYFKRRLLRRFFPCWGERVIAISEQVKEHLINDFKVEEKNIIVIHNGIDIDKFRIEYLKPKTEAKKDLGLADAPAVGIVARLSDVKGHIYLIEAMKEVLRDFPAAQLLIVGDGKEKKKLVKLADKLGIFRNVIFKAEVTDTREVLAAMDVFVMPSLKEGLGLALMEAMALGLPAIGSNIGGIKSLIKHGVNGLLVEAADSKGLAGAIKELFADPARRESFGRQARRFIAENFSQEKMVIETEKAYSELLA